MRKTTKKISIDVKENIILHKDESITNNDII